MAHVSIVYANVSSFWRDRDCGLGYLMFASSDRLAKGGSDTSTGNTVLGKAVVLCLDRQLTL